MLLMDIHNEDRKGKFVIIIFIFLFPDSSIEYCYATTIGTTPKYIILFREVMVRGNVHPILTSVINTYLRNF